MSAAEIVESNDHLLIEILVFLPPKSVFRFMSVSKRWKKIIHDPFFLRRRHSCSAAGGGGRLLALFQKSRMSAGPLIHARRPPMNILPIYTRAKCIKHIPTTLGRFINSSNGLILCCPDTTTHHVVNPVTGISVSLPPAPPQTDIYPYTSVGLMCEENTSKLIANYIVVRALKNTTTTMQMQTYSSKTGEWALSTLAATRNFGLLKAPPLVANGVFHWFGLPSTAVVYDPNSDNHPNHVQLIELPRDAYSIGRSTADTLWSGVIKSASMQLWTLPKGEDGSYMRATTITEDEWTLIYNISVESMYKDIASSYIKYFSFQAFVSWNPLVVLLKNKETLFLYNVESKSGEMVRYHGSLVSDEFYQDFVCPYLESSCLSSYAL